MKKIIVSIFITACFSSISNAQFSFKGGINLANQSYNTNIATGPIETSSILGYLVGINYKANLGLVSIRPGIEFSTKGANLTSSASANSSFGYIELPVDFVYSIGNVSVFSGPYMAFLLSAKNGEFDLKEDMKTLDAGLNIGLDFKIGNFGIGAKYGLGISDISEIVVNSIDISIKNNVLSLYLTYTL